MKEGSAPVKEKSSVRSKLFTAFGILLCIILLPILAVNVTMIVKSYINPDEVPTFGGYSPMIVLSPSMEDTIMTGDLIIIQETDAETVKEGEIISFFDPDMDGTKVNTHRVMEIKIDAEGNKTFITKGDNNNAMDPSPVPAESVIGRYMFRVPGAGNVAMFMQSTPGLIVCIAVPIILLVGYDLLMKKKYDKSKKKDTDALLAELEALRAKQAEMDGATEAPAQQPVAQPATPAQATPQAETPVQAASPAVASAPQQTASSDMAHIDALISEITDEDSSS